MLPSIKRAGGEGGGSRRRDGWGEGTGASVVSDSRSLLRNCKATGSIFLWLVQCTTDARPKVVLHVCSKLSVGVEPSLKLPYLRLETVHL